MGGLPGWFVDISFSRPNGQFHVFRGVIMLAKMVFTLFSSIWHSQNTCKQGYPFTNLRILYLIHILIAGRMQPYVLISIVMASIRREKIGSKKCNTVLVWRREVGQKLFGWCPHTYIQKGLPCGENRQKCWIFFLGEWSICFLSYENEKFDWWTRLALILHRGSNYIKHHCF